MPWQEGSRGFLMQTDQGPQLASVVQDTLIVPVVHTEAPLVVCSRRPVCRHPPPDPARQLISPGQVMKQAPERDT